MIAPLRARHRLWTGALAVAVPVLYVLALLARTEPPAVELPPALAEDASGEVVRAMDDLFADHAVTTRVLRSSSGFAVELEPRTPIVAPAVLVYWSPSQAAGEELPAEAFLLGSLAGSRARAFDLPAAALGRDGWLSLYSLGHQQVIDAAALAAVGAAVEESR